MALEIMPDPVYGLVELDPQLGIPRLVKKEGFIAGIAATVCKPEISAAHTRDELILRIPSWRRWRCTTGMD
jgi:REP element-mobilizing transposase RayT